jgi:hypothetical protein
LKVAGAQFRIGASMPLVPPVNEKLNAISWKMKKNAIVITTNVCLRTRSATSPSGTATAAATTAASGSRANTASPVSCQSWAHTATVYMPVPKNTACPRDR